MLERSPRCPFHVAGIDNGPMVTSESKIQKSRNPWYTGDIGPTVSGRHSMKKFMPIRYPMNALGAGNEPAVPSKLTSKKFDKCNVLHIYFKVFIKNASDSYFWILISRNIPRVSQLQYTQNSGPHQEVSTPTTSVQPIRRLWVQSKPAG